MAFKPAWVGGRILGVAVGDITAAVVTIDPESRESHVVAPLGAPDVSGNAQFLAAGFFADGRRMAFARERGETVGIWTMEFGTREERQVTPAEENGTFPVPSPDGRWIAYERVVDGSMHPVVIPATGGPGKQLTSGRGLTWPHSWTRDGERLFVAMRRGTSWSIGHVSASTGETTTVFSLPTAYGYVRYPAVSPKGDQVVFEQTETTGNIWQISLWDQTRGRAR
jgi:Tol biopolymer transport system component